MNDMIKPKEVGLAITKFCHIIGIIPSAYKLALTYEEQILAIGKYLEEEVYPAINENAEALKELQNLFIELKNYVENYFDNLDVQEEINNKLDEMAESGTLEEIISEYLQLKSLLCFDTVSALKNATNLVNGSFAKTYGFYEINDGGSAFYKIRTITNEDVVNNMNIIALNNDETLIAELITNSVVNVLQFGAKADNDTDNTLIFQTASNYAENNDLEFYIPIGIYVSNTFTINNVKKIKIDGIINLTNENQFLNIYQNFNGANTSSPNIYIKKVLNGTIQLKGLNSADVTIQNAFKLLLKADSSEGHNAIAYSKFYLGFIRHLEIADEGTNQIHWINENLFFGGRFLSITFNGTYQHNGNMFFKPMCEHTIITFNTGTQNKIIDARLEGSEISIVFGENTYGNIITSNYGSTLQTNYFPKYWNITNFVTDYSNGKNKFIINEYLTEHNVLNLNKFNNPKNISVSGENIVAEANEVIYETDIIELPPEIFCLFLYSNNINIYWRITCYDSNKNVVESNPDLMINSPTIGYQGNGMYGNGTFNRNDMWAIMDSSNSIAKYIKVRLIASPTEANNIYKDIQMFLTHLGKLTNKGYLIEGLKHSI